jgi:hypothetical protein
MSLEKKLMKLHEMLCDELIERLQSGEDGERPAPATLNVIRQFLRDNSIDGTLEDNDALKSLVEELPEEFKKTFMQ